MPSDVCFAESSADIPSRLPMIYAGARAAIPVTVAAVPFGIVTGIAAIEAGLSPALAMLMSASIFAGAAQLASSQLIANEVLPLVVVLTVWIINLRHMLYSASLASHLAGVSRPWQGLMAYLLTDMAYIIGMSMDGDRHRRDELPWFFLGAAATIWVVYQLANLLGIYLGSGVPAAWSLEFIATLAFITLLIPALVDRCLVIAALVGGVTAVLGAALPYNLGLLLAALAGILAGVLAEEVRRG